MSIKDMKRSDWHRCVRKDYIAKDFELGGQQGQMSLSILRELTGPLTIHYPFGDILIADKDYRWVQIALKDRFFWVTAMYDSEDRLIDLYFDITKGNHFDTPENPWFEDMYLDIVVAGDEIMVLDQDELDEALAEGAITKEAYDHAVEVCHTLYDYLLTSKDEVISLCEKSYRELKTQIG